jgi:hypothetical protein
MLVAAVGVFPQIALVVVTIALRPVIASAVDTVPLSVLISVLASFVVAIIVVIRILRPRHGAECERNRSR